MPVRDKDFSRTFITQATHRRRTDGDPSIFLDYANIGNEYTPGRNHTNIRVQAHFDSTCPVGMTIYDGTNNITNNGSDYFYNLVDIQDQHLEPQDHAPVAGEYTPTTINFTRFNAWTNFGSGIGGPGLAPGSTATVDALHITVDYSPITLTQNLDLSVPEDIQRNPALVTYHAIISVSGQLRILNLRLIALDLVSLDTNNAATFLKHWTEIDFLRDASKVGTTEVLTASDYKPIDFSNWIPTEGGKFAFRATVRDYAASPPIDYDELVPAYSSFTGIKPTGTTHGGGVITTDGPQAIIIGEIGQTGTIRFILKDSFV